MSLTDTANEGIKTAMKAKDDASLRAYRAIKAALLLAKTDKGDAEIDHDTEIKLLQKLVKQRKESLEIYIKQDRPDLAKPEEEELLIIESFLPKQMGEKEIREIIAIIVEENHLKGQQSIGKLMPLAMKALAGKADGKVISAIAKELLGVIKKMGTIDLILILPVALAIIAGFRKGLIIEIASLIAFVLAIIACLELTHRAMELLLPYTGHTKWLPFVSYLLVFILVYALVIWIGKLLEKVVKIIQLGTFNRILGSAFSLLKMCFFISLFFWLADMIHLVPKQSESQSYIYKTLHGFAPTFFSWASGSLPWAKGEVGQIEKFFGNVAK